MKNKKFIKTICIDFDGVLHSYESGWKGASIIPDGPVPGAIEWVNNLIEHDGIKPVIYSSRSKEVAGVVAMKAWLLKHGVDKHAIQSGILEFPVQKPAAFLTIDDRAICFNGVFPSVSRIESFVPWNKGAAKGNRHADKFAEMSGRLSAVKDGYTEAVRALLTDQTSEIEHAISELRRIVEILDDVHDHNDFEDDTNMQLVSSTRDLLTLTERLRKML